MLDPLNLFNVIYIYIRYLYYIFSTYLLTFFHGFYFHYVFNLSVSIHLSFSYVTIHDN